MKPVLIFPAIILALLVGGCSAATPYQTPTSQNISSVDAHPAKTSPTQSQATNSTPDSTQTSTPGNAKPTEAPTAVNTLPPAKSPTSEPSATASVEPTRRPTLALYAWRFLPVVPVVSNRVFEIYQRGLELGNNPRAFSKIGDCGSTPAWFLGDFDRGPDFYELGEYQDLVGVINEYQGSFGRTSLAARSGFNASSLFVPLWADRSQCESDETPLACEYRDNRPVIAFIMLGANDVWHPDEFEPQMRKIIEFSIENGIIPILSTKADNQEGDESINAAIASLAWEYEIPLWNFWRAAQELPDNGLQEDAVHLTWGRNFFDNPNAMSKGWPVRNLTALQTLNAIWLKTTQQNQ